MKNKNIAEKVLAFLVALTILFFLSRILFVNWQKIKNYQFSFNYFYLFLSYIFLSLNIALAGVVWGTILRFLKVGKIPIWPIIKTVIYSRLGRYVPGRVWSLASRVYLARRFGIPPQALFISSLQQMVINILSNLVWGLFLVFVSLGSKINYLSYYQLLFIIVISVVIIFIAKPDFYFPVYRFLLSKTKKINFNPQYFLQQRKDIIIVFLLVAITQFTGGLAFFFLVNSIVKLSYLNLWGVIGAYMLATVSGFIVLFTPGGIGVKEGVLALLLSFYFPLNIAVFISLLSLLWMVTAELMLFSVVFFGARVKRFKFLKS